nr:single-stranded-DNA-specific exonuclease C-terminal domain-containing protein [Companilactobacillus mishanensis]
MIGDFEVSPKAAKINQLQSIYIDYRSKMLSQAIMEKFDSIVFFNQAYYDMVKRHNIDAKIKMFNEDCGGDNVLVYDRPHDIELFKEFLKNNKTQHTALYLHTDMNARYLRPDMAKMKQLLKYLYSHQNIQMDEMNLVGDYLKMDKNDIDFYLKVFFELDFVKMVNGFVEKAEVSKQRELIESPTYMKRLQRNDVEKILIESNFANVLDWISQYDCHD